MASSPIILPPDHFDRLESSGQVPVTLPPDHFDKLEAQAKSLHKGMSDDDIIKRYGYDPTEIKKSHLYSAGDLSSEIDDPHSNSILSALGNSPVGAAGFGVENIISGVAQLAAHTLAKVGIASDADAKYIDLYRKLATENYHQNIRKGEPDGVVSKVAEALPSLLLPIPGGPAKTMLGAFGRGVLGGAAAASTQGVDSTNPDSSYFKNKAEQISAGGLTGGVVSALTHGVIKGINTKSTSIPEDTARALQVQADADSVAAKRAAETAQGRILQDQVSVQAAKDKAAGQILQDKVSATTQLDSSAQSRVAAQQQLVDAKQNLAEHKLSIGEVARKAQQKAEQAAIESTVQSQNNATSASSRLRASVGGTPFNGTGDLIESAGKGDGRAGKVLQQLLDAGDNPDRIQQASIQLRNWQTRRVATELYDKVGEIAQEREFEDVPMSRTTRTVNTLLDEAESAKIPDSTLVNTLKTVQKNIGAKDNMPSDNGYNIIRRFDDDLGNLIRSGQKGNNALVSDTSVPALNKLRMALRQDLDAYANTHPELRDAAKTADEYYKANRVPFKQPDIAKAGTTPDPDSIYDQFIRQGSGDKAQRYYSALEDKGRAAVRSQMAIDAVNHATDPVSGEFNPRKFVEALSKVSDSHNVFFSGTDREEMQGLVNLAKQAALKTESVSSVARNVINAAKPTLESLAAETAKARSVRAKVRLSDLITRKGIADNLAAASERYRAEAENVAREADLARLQHTATAEDVARVAARSQESAKAAQDAVDKSRGSTPYGSIALGAGATAGALSSVGLHSLAAIPGSVAGVAGAMKVLTQTEGGRRFAAAAGRLQPGSAELQKLLDGLPKLAGYETGNKMQGR